MQKISTVQNGFRAMVAPDSFNEETSTVDVTFATDAKVLRWSWDMPNDGYFYEVLGMESGMIRMERLMNGAPVLNSHEKYELSDQIGVVENARLENGQAVATLKFSQREEIKGIVDDIKAGIIRNVSVGYRVHKYVLDEMSEEKYPVYRAIDWEPFEISMVTVPADFACTVRSDKDKNTAHVSIVDALPQNETPETRADSGDLSKQNSESKMENKEPVLTDEQLRLLEEAKKAERQRIADIDNAIRIAKLENTADLRARLIDGNHTIDQAREMIFAEWERQDPTKDIKGTNTDSRAKGDDRENVRMGMEAGLMLRGMQDQHLTDKQKTLGQQFRGFSLLDLCRRSLELGGMKRSEIDGLSRMELAKRAITQNTGDLPVILGNVIRQVLLQNYQNTADTWTNFCAVGSLIDFRAHDRIRMGTFGSLDTVAENAEYKYKSIPDGEKESITGKTVGNLINVSRQMIINDDLGALMRLPAMLGRAAKLSIEKDVYALLAANPLMGDGVALFDAAHGNIGTGAALSVDSIDADRVLMKSQQDPDGNDYLDIMPSVLLVPVGLGGQARVVNDAQYDFDQSNKFQKPNKVRGLFQTIVDTPRLSGTTRYLFADPNVEPVIEVGFLNGESMPYLEQQEAWNQDGTEWKVRMDYGVAAVGYRGVVRNAGA